MMNKVHIYIIFFISLLQNNYQWYTQVRCSYNCLFPLRMIHVTPSQSRDVCSFIIPGQITHSYLHRVMFVLFDMHRHKCVFCVSVSASHELIKTRNQKRRWNVQYIHPGENVIRKENLLLCTKNNRRQQFLCLFQEDKIIFRISSLKKLNLAYQDKIKDFINLLYIAN